MSDLLDAAAALLLAAVMFTTGFVVGGQAGGLLGLSGALSAGYVAARVGTLRQRVADLEAQLDDAE